MRTVKTDQSGRMPRLIGVFIGRTGQFVGFVMLQLILYVPVPHNCLCSSVPLISRYFFSFVLLKFPKTRGGPDFKMD